ncbi:hypothetical protein Trydic_g11412 [Trypoxylus dichotomus]
MEQRPERPSILGETIAKMVEAMLKDRRMTVQELSACEFLRTYETDGEEFLDSIVTGDEICDHYITTETEQRSCQWKLPESPKPRKFKQTLSAGKVMAMMFWNRKGLLLYEFMPAVATINANCYCKTLENLRRAIHRDNARLHTAQRTSSTNLDELLSHTRPTAQTQT